MVRVTRVYGLVLSGLVGLTACGGGAEGAGGVEGSEGADDVSCRSDVDTDGDGLDDCREVGLKTSPSMADTDGDGYSDFDEVVTKAFSPEVDNYQFNPLIADLPKLQIRLVSVPSISLIYEEQESTGKRLSTSTSQGTTAGISWTSGGSSSRAVEVSHTVSGSVTGEISATPSLTVEVGYEYSHATTNETSINWSKDETQENTRVYEEAEELEQTEGVSFTGGELSVTVAIENAGHIAYELSDLTLTAYESNPRLPGELTPVGTLTFLSKGNSNPFPRTVIGPGEVKTGFVFSTDLDLGTARELLRDSENLVIRPATYAMVDSERTFGLEATEVRAKTAEVIVDLGPDLPVSAYQVAIAQLDHPNVGHVLRDVLGIDFEVGVGSWSHVPGEPLEATYQGLVGVRGKSSDPEHGGYFLVAHSKKTERGNGWDTTVYNLNQAGYDFAALPLHQGDVLNLVFTQDEDRDGLPARLERDLGTDPESRDTDGDGLSDVVEFVGWQFPCDARARTWVYPNPLLEDSDADGVSDLTEWNQCTDPSDGGAG